MRLTVQDAARLLNVSEKTVYRWIKQGTLPTYRVSDQYRFNAAELLAWATSRRLNVSEDIFTATEIPGTPLPDLAETLQAGGIFYRLEGDTREAALRDLVEHMRLPEGTDREYLLRLMVAREHLGSTALADGIAVPQILHPTSLELARPVASVAFLEHPVPWESLDARPVDVLVALVCPNLRAHLHLERRLAFALRQPSFVEGLRRQGRREEILDRVRGVERALP